MTDKKLKVCFLCVHNSCRSQMAEAIAKLKYSDCFEAYSAGTEIGRPINPQAVKVIKDIYGYDMLKTQRPKHIDELPKVDIVISMGCNVQCPFLPCIHKEDWGLEDPSGKDNGAFVDTINKIEEKLKKLCEFCNQHKNTSVR